LAHLHLEPRARARVGLVRRAFVLRDDPFPAESLRLAVRRFPIADDAARQEDRTGAPADETLERGAPVGERPVVKRAPGELEQIEDRVARARRPGGATALQQLKARDALVVERDELAVEDEVAVRKRSDCGGHVGKAA